MSELGLADTSGILRQDGVSPRRDSSGLGWHDLYVSSQEESPYGAEFGAARTHLLILHLTGPVAVSRGQGRSRQSRTVPRGGLFIHPAGQSLTVELGGRLDSVHAYLTDEALARANDGLPVEPAEELGASDPLIEQLMLALEGVVRRWEPSARTYADHVTAMLAAQLARRNRQGAGSQATAPPTGLSTRQLSAVRELMEQRLAEPLPVADLAAAASLSASQFTRQFKASTGESPHQYLLRLRLEQAQRLLRAGATGIAEVALSCGFSQQEHLTRVMRAKLGTTPAAVRRAG